jgi:hypothetical protein
MKIQLPTVTLAMVCCHIDFRIAKEIISFSTGKIDFGKIIIFSSKQCPHIDLNYKYLKLIRHIGSKEAYSYFCTYNLSKYVEGTHCLIVQPDGFILNPKAWTNSFLKYDYIGAPWRFKDEHNVGNGALALEEGIRGLKNIRILDVRKFIRSSREAKDLSHFSREGIISLFTEVVKTLVDLGQVEMDDEFFSSLLELKTAS